jgi:ribonuclease HI
MAIFFQNFSTWKARPGLYLEDLFVSPAHRKKGIGAALLRRLALICDERGYGRMEWAVLEWNELAKAQYRKMGAAPMEEWRTWRLADGALADYIAEARRLEEAPPPASVEEESSAEAESSDVVTIHTDGGARPNPGVGGWAAALQSGGKVRMISGGEDKTTNNRMELTAAIEALKALKRPCEVRLVTDSEYLRNGITSWIIKWKKNGWRRGVKKDAPPVLNADLWQELDRLVSLHKVAFEWTRGHSGNHLNERCDELCSIEIERREAALRKHR